MFNVQIVMTFKFKKKKIPIVFRDKISKLTVKRRVFSTAKLGIQGN